MPASITPVSFGLWSYSPDTFADGFGRSLAETGFAIVADHGLDAGMLERALSAAKAFFALPEAAKLDYRVPGGAGQRGYTPFGLEAAKGAEGRDLKEFWHVGRELARDHPLAAQMPHNLNVAEIPGWREATGGMFDAMDALGRQLLSALAMWLGLSSDHFDDSVRDGDSILRLLHYPPQPTPPPAGSIRAAAHEDINVITLLLGAEEGGLEVLRRDGSWLPINPEPGSLVVNIGDMLQRLTNHTLPSTTHRVMNPAPERAARPRYSTPYFLHFRPDFEIVTLPGCIAPDRPNLYPASITARAYLRERLAEIGLA